MGITLASYTINSFETVEPEAIIRGHVGFGAASASMEFKEIKVIREGASIIPNIRDYVQKEGKWELNSAGNLTITKG